jgi:steroid 5-alpha reductase family enzyme
VLVATLVVALAAMVALWGLSLRMRDASIADPWWGPGFVLIGTAAWMMAPTTTPRAVLVMALVKLWAFRLALYLLWRRLGHGEDARYAAMRRHWGERFWLVSLGTVFVLQGVLMWIVSWPVQAAVLAPRTPLGPSDAAGVVLWTVGMFFETVGDWQLARFKADPANAGRVMDQGLWRLTRHPNYFGDFCVWWGIFLVACAAGGWWTLPGPVVMSVLLMRVSGVPLLEKSLRRTRSGYADYVARTSAFFPRPPRAV